jgi:hypothetical protein
MTGSLAETVLVFCENGNATEQAERVLARIFKAERNVETMREYAPSPSASASPNLHGPTWRSRRHG